MVDSIDISEFNDANKITPTTNPDSSEQPPHEIKDRITVVDSIYYQSEGEPIIDVVSRFESEVKDSEQVYTRRMVAKDKWTAIDIGWLKSTGMLVILNKEKPNSQIIPSQE
jgi:hypothetical protein